MKTIMTLGFAVLVTTVCFAETASAQSFNIDFSRFTENETRGNSQASRRGGDRHRPHPGRPSVSDPHNHRGYRPNPYNNPIYVRPTEVERLEFDPSTGRWRVKASSEVIHESATDPNRHIVDRGSYRVSSSVSRDRFGRTIETRVESWTSFGVPHSNTTRRVKQDLGGVTIEEEHNSVRSIGRP